MKTLAKLNAKGFTVQNIVEAGFSFEDNNLVNSKYNYKVQIGEKEGYIVESMVPPTLAGNNFYKVFYPLTNNLKGVEDFSYESGVPSKGGYFPLYKPNKENIIADAASLKENYIKNTGIFNIEGALSFERVSKENLISFPKDFSTWRDFFYKVDSVESSVSKVDSTEEEASVEETVNSFRKSPLGTYDTASFTAKDFTTSSTRLVWVIPIRNSISKSSEKSCCFSFYLNKKFIYIKDIDIQYINTTTQIDSVDNLKTVLSELSESNINKVVGETDTIETFTTNNQNTFYKISNNEWQRFAVSFDLQNITFQKDSYNYVIIKFTPGLELNSNTIHKECKLQVCAPMFEMGYLPSPYQVIREKKNTNNLFEINYKYPLVFNFNRFNTTTENILNLSKKWLISYKRKFESTLTTQKGKFSDSLGNGTVWWGYGYSQDTGNLQVNFSSGTLDYINNWTFDPKKVLNKWESVFIYPTEDKKICIEVHLEDGDYYRINTSIIEDTTLMGYLVGNDNGYHLSLGGVDQSSEYTKYNGYYKDLLFISENEENTVLDIQESIKEILTNKLALCNRNNITILQTERLKEGF